MCRRRRRAGPATSAPTFQRQRTFPLRGSRRDEAAVGRAEVARRPSLVDHGRRDQGLRPCGSSRATAPVAQVAAAEACRPPRPRRASAPPARGRRRSHGAGGALQTRLAASRRPGRRGPRRPRPRASSVDAGREARRTAGLRRPAVGARAPDARLRPCRPRRARRRGSRAGRDHAPAGPRRASAGARLPASRARTAPSRVATNTPMVVRGERRPRRRRRADAVQRVVMGKSGRGDPGRGDRGAQRRTRHRERGREDGAHVPSAGTITSSARLARHRPGRGIIRPSEAADRMERDTILILDFGSQYTQLIARRLRELQVYSEILPPTHDRRGPQGARSPRGIVLSGGPDSVLRQGRAPLRPPASSSSGVPVLGICYGMQLMSHVLGGEVQRAGRREYGHAQLRAADDGPLLHGPRARDPRVDEPRRLDPRSRRPASRSWARAGTQRGGGHRGPATGASSASCSTPRSTHTEEGTTRARELPRRLRVPARLERGLVRRRGRSRRSASRWADGRVICALSGGVDSAVAALLVHRAIGDRLTCVFVDNGLLRKDEARAGAAPLRRAAAAQGGVRGRLARGSWRSSRA